MTKNILIFILLNFLLKSAYSDHLKFEFIWGDVPSCTDGKSFEVKSPKFIFSSLPKDAKWVYLKIRNIGLSDFDHGGGWVELKGKSTIESGKFNYFSSCPKSGKEIFQWTAYFTTKKSSLLFYGQPLGVIHKVSSKKKYP